MKKTFVSILLVLGISFVAQATTYYWTTAGGTWAGSNWSDNATSGGTTGIEPLATDSVVLNQSTVNGGETISITNSFTLAGMTIRNTGATVLYSSSTNTQTLTIGSGGITMDAGAGTVTLGNGSNRGESLALDGSQTWNNNSSSLFRHKMGTTTTLNSLGLGANTLTLDGTGTGGWQFDAPITGTGGLIKNGTGALILAGTNTYGGGTVLNSGTLNLNTTNALSTGGLTINGGALDNTSAAAIDMTNNNALTINNNFAYTGSAANKNLSLGAGVTTLGSAAGTSRAITVTAQQLTLDGDIANGTTANQLIKDGAGTLALDGTNTFTGGVVIKKGTLNFGRYGYTAGGTSTAAGTGTITLGDAAGSNAYLSTGSYTVTNDINLAPGAVGSLAIGSTGATRSPVYTGAIALNGNTLNFDVSGSSATLKNYGAITGVGNLVLSNRTTTSGSIQLISNVVNITGAITSYGATSTNPNANVISGNIGPNVTSVTVSKGALTLSGTNSYTGDTILGATANLNVSKAENLGNGANVWVGQNASLTATAGFTTSKNLIMTNAGTSVVVSSGVLELNGNLINGGDAFPQVAVSGAGMLRLNSANNTFGSSYLLINGGGSLGLGNANALNGAVLKYNAGKGLDNLSGAAMKVTGLRGLSLTTSFTFNGTDNLDMSDVPTRFVQTAGTLRTITVSNKVLMLSGILSSGTDATGTAGVSGGLIKAGAGTLILNGNSDYTMNTVVTNGTLIIDGAMLSSNITAYSGATLGGTGAVPVVTMASGSTLAVGNGGVGTMAFNGDLTLSSGSTNIMQIASDVSHDILMGAGTNTLTMSGVTALDFTGFSVGDGHTFTLSNLFQNWSISNDTATYEAIGLQPGQTVSVTNGVMTVIGSGVPSYTLTINSGSGGGSYTNEAVVQITANVPPAGHTFDQWIGDTQYVGSVLSSATTETMPAQTVNLTATYKLATEASDSWKADVSGNWDVGNSWLGGNIPGSTNSTVSANSAIFDVALTTNRVVTVDANRNIGTIRFANPANSGSNNAITVGYTLTNGNLRLSNGGVIEVVAGSGSNNAAIGSPILIEGDGGSATIRNDSAAAGLGITGTITGNSTAGNTTILYFDGINTQSSTSGGRNNSTAGISDGANGGNVKVIKNGTGLWSLSLSSTASTFTGGLEINAGFIRYFGAGPGGFGHGSVTIGTNVTFSHGNTILTTLTNALVVNGNYTLNGDNTTWTGPINLGSAVRTVTVNTGGTNNILSGVISNGGLIKAGAGQLTLSGLNDYSDGTMVTGGTLIATSNGALGSGNVMVAGGAKLTLTNATANNFISDLAALVLGTNSTLNLNFSGSDTIKYLSLDGGTNWLRAGVYSAADLATNGIGVYTGSGTLTVQATMGSSYTLTVNSGSGSGKYAELQEVNIIANEPPAGQMFDQWVGDTDYVTDVLSADTFVTMPAQDITLTATYKDIQYVLTVDGGTGGGSYTNGAQVEIIADEPPAGQVFDQWVGDTDFVKDVFAATTTVTMPALDIILTASYKNIYTLTVNGGSGSGSYADQQQVEIAADKPAEGLAFARWTGDADYVKDAASASTTVTMPAQDITLTATYTAWNTADFTYVTNGSEITITGYIGSGGDVSIPSLIDGLPVTRIDQSAFMYKDLLTGVVIPDSITSIGGWAFMACTNLTAVTLPSAITSLDSETFSGCTSLGAITIPDSVTDIGGMAFFNCTGLKDVTFGISVASIGNNAFNSCSSLTGITFPDSLTSIGEHAFEACSSLGSVTIPDSVISLGNNAFERCGNLTEATIGSGVTDLMDFTFGMCTNLISVTMGDGVTNIGMQVFYSNTSLTNVVMGANVASIGDMAFQGCTSLTDITIPASVTSIGSGAFYSSTNLAGVYFFGNAPVLGMDVFLGDSNATVYHLSSATGWPDVPDLFGGRPTALWDPVYPLTVNSGSGSGSYVDQQQVEITADAPATGQEFDQWVGDTDYVADIYSAATTVTMPAKAITLTATYRDVQYTLTVNNGTGGGSYTYQQQAEISAAAPATGKVFDRWTGDTQYVASVTAADTTVTMPAQSIALTATYKNIQYTLTVNNGTGGGLYTNSTQVNIAAAAPASGKTFDRWTGATQYVANVTASNTTVTMPLGNITVTATYKDLANVLTVTGGSGSGSYTNGAQVPITAGTPAAGKVFDQWIGDTQYVASVTSAVTTVTMPAQAASLTATYKDQGYPLTVIYGTGSGSYTNGSRVTIAASARAGLVFDRWTGSTQYVAGVTSSTAIVTMPAQAISLTATYVADTTKPTVAITLPTAALRILSNEFYTVRGTATDNKVVTNVLVKLNNGEYLPAVTTNGWKNWSALVQLVAGSNTVRAYSVDSAVNNSLTSTVACTYVVPGTLTVRTNGLGTVARAPATAPEVGATYTLTATPGTGFGFANWTGDVTTSTNKVLSFTMTTNKTLTANFVDIAKPTVAITAPTAALRVSNSLYTVKGTATDNGVMTGVFCRVNSGTWTLASTTNLTTNVWKSWSIPVTLTAGSNLVQAYSIDSAGNSSATSSVSCTYVVPGTLTVTTNGVGTVTRAPATPPEVNQKYTLTAAAGTGSVFSNWTGDVTSTNKVITFTMATNLAIRANFTDIAKPTVAITAPTALQRILGTNGEFTVKGTATDNSTLSNVMVKVNTDAPVPASTTTNGWKNWSLPVMLTPGTNIIAAYSVDTTGNCSLTVTTKCVYVETGTLIINTNGPGTVAIAPAGALELGKSYTLTATAGTGGVFSNWTGDVSSTGKVVTISLTVSNRTKTVSANFTDTAKPTVTITSPTAAQRVMTNGTVILRGTAADNGVLGSVRYQLGTGEWTNAVSTNIWKNWTAACIPVVGTNIAKVCSVDVQGNTSATSTVVFTYVPGAIMLVETNGNGTITPSYNGQVLEIGKSYTMTATAKTGNVFTNWTDGIGVVTNKAAVTFKMTSNLVLTANFRSLTPMPAPMDAVVAQAEITVDGATADWAYVPRTVFSYASVTQEVAAALSGNNIALLLSGCPFSTSDTVLVYFKLRLSYSSGEARHSVDLWTSGKVLYGMVDGQIITGFEAVLVSGVLEIKFPVEQTPSQIVIEEAGCGIDAGNGALTELFRITPPSATP